MEALMSASAAPERAARSPDGRSKWAPFARASGLVLLAALLLRFALLALGRAVDAAFELDRVASFLLDCALVGVSITLLVAARRFAASRGLGLRHALPASLAVLLLGLLAWKRSLRPITFHDFFGVWTPIASQRWTDSRPGLPHITYRHDRHGFRGAGFEDAKAKGRVRVALVGDSFIFGLGVEEEQTLKGYLDEELARRGLADKVEVLNLGIPGANLATHVRMVERARERLNADVIVLGLFEDNDLSAWDIQDEIEESARFGPFSLGVLVLGERPAVGLATVFAKIRGCASALATFDAIEPRLAELRAREGNPPLIVLDYFSHHEEVERRFLARPNVAFIATAERGEPPPEHHIPGDGHPSARGNEAFAARVIEKLLALPEVAALALPP
jgi:hypothetical protein